MQEKHNSNHRRSWTVGALAVVAILPWAGLAYGHQKPGGQRRSTDPPGMSKGKLGQDLFLSVDHRDVASVQALLKQGADANSRNGLEFTPLFVASASHQPDIMKALLAAGAKPDLDSPYGTALTFAAMGGHDEGAKILLEKGANPNTVRVDGDTVLMMAAQSGNPALVGVLLKHGAKVNLPSYNGSTPLSYAARGGHVASGQMLLDAGANINFVDDDKQTPLMEAAKAGNTDFVKLLLKRGAKVNLRNNFGQTPLMLATAYGTSTEAVKAIVAAGANTQAKDPQGRTAGMIAAKRGFVESAKLLGVKNSSAVIRTEKDASVVSLALLQRSMTAFNKRTNCISCHHEGLGRMALASASQRGFTLDQALVKAQSGRVGGAFGFMKPLHDKALTDGEAMKQVPLIEINEVSTGYSWLLSGMAAQNEAPSPASAAATMVLAKQQSPNGSWTISGPRVPMQSSLFTYTALAIRAMKTYGPKSSSDEINGRIEKAKAWLLSAPATTSDDLAFRLLGLNWAGASMDEKKVAIHELLAGQQADGGWSQLPGMHSDAYASGQVLYALSVAGGMSKSDAAFAKGVKYLLRTQDDDGSWFVSKRAVPGNNYFDSAFPHAESQYASFNATCWANMALMETLPRKK